MKNQPEVHVIAAGSMLEFALRKLPSYGIGRIENLFMYPLSFREYLMAKGKQNLLPLIDRSGPLLPVDPVFHDRLVEVLKEFLFVGGMPEVVSLYIESGDLRAAQRMLDQYLTALMDDFAKYSKKCPVTRLREVFDAVAHHPVLTLISQSSKS